MKKCLLCDKIFDINDQIWQHYETYHDVGKKIYYFCTDLFVKDKRRFVPTNCLSCDRFLINSKDRKLHNFLKHYKQDGALSFENRPVNISRVEGLVP